MKRNTIALLAAVAVQLLATSFAVRHRIGDPANTGIAIVLFGLATFLLARHYLPHPPRPAPRM
jgi:hypothetical protein